MTSNNKRAHASFSRIRAVILDYGEVLCLRPEAGALSRMASVFRIDPSQFLEFYRSSRGPYDQGLITVEDYWLDFARRAGVRIDAGMIGRLRRWDTEMWSRINPHMTEWLQTLHRGGFTTALLSNMETDMVAYVRKNFSWLAHFHHQIFSCEVGLIKPDFAIFHHCTQRIGLRPEEALLVDDRQENVEAARTTGITAIQFQSVKQLRTDLKEMRFEILPQTNELRNRRNN
jgi:putative hydrolase of the HAD superfamily